jgi:glycosyltransferase involved in cell wall biosynthesis
MDYFDQGGLENVVHNLAMGLNRENHEVLILVLEKAGVAAERARRAGFRVLTLPAQGRDEQYSKLLADESIELVHAHYSVFGASLASAQGVPFVQVVHNSYVWLGDDAIAAYQEADRSTTAYVCVSSEVAQYCDRRIGLSVPKMLVIPNGIDTHWLDSARSISPHQLRREIGFESRDFVFLNVASVHATKAQMALVKAMAEVVRAQPHARLVMVGASVDRAYWDRLTSQIASLGLERSVILAGHRDDVARFYWMADTFVLPSYWEGWSLALSEAVYTGIPVIASDVGGARELLANTNGQLVKPPFASICDLDSFSIGGLVVREDSGYVAALAQAMIAACQSRDRLAVTDRVRDSVLLRLMVERHSLAIDWLLQGGDPAAARAWIRDQARPHALARAGAELKEPGLAA